MCTHIFNKYIFSYFIHCVNFNIYYYYYFFNIYKFLQINYIFTFSFYNTRVIIFNLKTFNNVSLIVTFISHFIYSQLTRAVQFLLSLIVSTLLALYKIV